MLRPQSFDYPPFVMLGDDRKFVDPRLLSTQH
jgi:hypothetical protein